MKYLAGLALFLGALAAFAGSPRKQVNARVDVAGLARTVEREDDHVSALELAGWIRSARPRLRIIDVRDSADFEDYHLPLAERIPVAGLTSARFGKDETIVLYSGGDGRAAEGWVFLRALGYSHAYFLRGGVYEWLDDVMNPVIPGAASGVDSLEIERIAALSRYFGGAPRPGGPASPRSAVPIPQEGAVHEAVSRIRGRGC